MVGKKHSFDSTTLYWSYFIEVAAIRRRMFFQNIIPEVKERMVLIWRTLLFFRPRNRHTLQR